MKRPRPVKKRRPRPRGPVAPATPKGSGARIPPERLVGLLQRLAEARCESLPPSTRWRCRYQVARGARCVEESPEAALGWVLLDMAADCPVEPPVACAHRVTTADRARTRGRAGQLDLCAWRPPMLRPGLGQRRVPGLMMLAAALGRYP